MIGDFFDDVQDDVIPSLSDTMTTSKAGKKRIETANKWMDWAKDKMPTSFAIHFDTVNKEYTLLSDEQDAKGRPMYEWKWQDGKEWWTERAKDGSETTITQK